MEITGITILPGFTFIFNKILDFHAGIFTPSSTGKEQFFEIAAFNITPPQDVNQTQSNLIDNRNQIN